MKNPGCLIFLIFLTSQLLAQNQDVQKDKRLGILTGFSNFSLDDEIGSNLKYSGSALPFLLNYYTGSGSSIKFLELTLDTPVASNSFTNSEMKGTFLTIQYTFSKAIPGVHLLGSTLFLGGGSRVSGTRKNYRIGFSEQTTGEIILDLRINSILRYVLKNQQQLTVKVDMALLGYGISKEFNGSFTGGVFLPGKLLAFSFETGYLLPINDRIHMNFKYALQYLELNRTNSVKMLNYKILAGINFKIGSNE